VIEVDPAIRLLIALCTALLFVSAAIHKLREPMRFAAALAAYEILPGPLVASVARLLPLVELSCAVGVLVEATRYWSAVCAIGLLVAYSAAIATNLWRGRAHIDCGCAGFVGRRPLAGWMVARNAVVAVSLVALLADSGTRVLTWTDALTVFGGVSVTVCLYVAVEGLFGRGTTFSRESTS
jgi:hypothetical protein